MSGKFIGITFANQKVSPTDDAVIYRAILPDGKLSGCEISYSGSTLTMSAGRLLVCGRHLRNPSAQNWPIVDATSGFARLVLTIDLTRTATKETFDQVVDSIEYATSEDGFVTLDQPDINGSGTRYQIAVCTVSLGAGGITGIVSQLEKCEAGAGLNFKVVGGVTQPNDPKENTIWVNTAAKITDWSFSADTPKEPTDGAVWFTVGSVSTVAFEALKKNSIRVYPVSAKQYISGAWVDLVAKTYQNGAWNDWVRLTYLYNDGNECTDITGGWKTTAYYNGPADSGGYPGNPSITRGDKTLTIENGGSFGFAYTKNKIDLTNYNTIVFHGDVVKFNECRLCVMKTADGDYVPSVAASVKFHGVANSVEYRLDVSKLSEIFHIGVLMEGDTQINVARIYLEE